MEKNAFIEAGRIVNTHGVQGEVKIEVWLDSPKFFKSFKRLYTAGGQELKVLSARTHKDFVIAKLEGVEDVNAAVINGNYALEAGLNPAKDALIIEAADSDESYKYINYLVVKAGNEETAKTKALIAAFANQDVADFINKTYPGSVIPSADLVK